MTKVTTGATMSLDGFIADEQHGGFDYLFQWYDAGDVETQYPTGMTVKTSRASADHLRDLLDRSGALVVGRTLFDIAKGWDGKHPMGVPVVVLTHSVPEGWEPEGEWFVFVSTGIEDAVAKAKELAGDKDVGLNGGTIAKQAMEAGLIDEVHVDLVPVLLGKGIPFFGDLSNKPLKLDGPFNVTEGLGVTHLAYRVNR